MTPVSKSAPQRILGKIVKRGDKWEVRSEDGGKLLGTYDSKAEAEKRLREIEYFKEATRVAASASLAGDDGVERLGPGMAPTAFRIWKAGGNPTDMGVHVFSPRSAKLLIESQAKRGNRFSIDVDHMSLNQESPPESRKAVGWHSLAVRDTAEGPELWAVEVEWTPAVKSGLESSPPEWRYFSPAYDVDKATKEIVGYLNTALTNNPATHRVTALAAKTQRIAANTTRKTATMNFQQMAADMAGDDDDKKKEARTRLSAMSEVEKKAWKAWKKAAFDDNDGDEGGKEEKKEEGTATAKAAEESKKEEAAVKAAEEPKEKKEEASQVAASLSRLDSFLAVQAKKESELEIKSLLATRPDLDAATKTWLASQPLATVKGAVETLPRTSRAFSVAANAGFATSQLQGATQGDFDMPLPPDMTSVIDRVMGTAPAQKSALVLGVADLEAAKRHLASRASEGSK